VKATFGRTVRLSLAILTGLTSLFPAAGRGAPAAAQENPSESGGAGAAIQDPPGEAKPRAVIEFEADERLGKRLLQAPGDVQGKTRYLFELAANDAEPDTELKKAAMRRIRDTEPRVVTAVVTARLAASPPQVQLDMLQITREIYQQIGGVDATLDDALTERIRDGSPPVAAKAIEVTSELGIKSAYLPLREVAGTPGSPLRGQAIDAMARLRDPRSVTYFKKLLESDGAPKEKLYEGLAVIGRPSALLLKEKMNATNPRDRDLACDALITMADGDDLSALYAYIQKYPPEGERKQRIYDVIATIEARGQERPAGE
jgi:hypothetical protein